MTCLPREAVIGVLLTSVNCSFCAVEFGIGTTIPSITSMSRVRLQGFLVRQVSLAKSRSVSCSTFINNPVIRRYVVSKLTASLDEQLKNTKKYWGSEKTHSRNAQ